MRFVEQGADIPDELIRAVTDGSATFLCGAGVSFRVNLPSFKLLTDRVYALLDEAPHDEPAERIAIESQQYDRALRSLEKRTHRPRMPSRVRDAVASLLAPPTVTFPDHLALLQLSRDGDGRPRLLTTNFDTLFERAARDAGMLEVPSYAGVSMPRAGGERDHGILHLHGRIADDTLNLEPTDLILTSADFGEAYLRSGWASRYIEERMRLGTLVLVGYAAEDAAMRLLLETLDADRDRFRDLHDIYAIERGTPTSASIWKAKGIKPIEFPDYDAIYNTLSEWARYAMQPVDYRRARVRDILRDGAGGCVMTEDAKAIAPNRKTPADATPFEREQLRFFLSGADLAATLSEFNPSLAWLPYLSEMKLIGSERQLVAWIERNFADVDAVRDVVANIHFFGRETADFLEFRLNAQRADLPPLLVKSWGLIIRHMRTAKSGLAQNEWFEIAPQLKRGDHAAPLLERLANALRPKLKVGKRFSWGDTAEGEVPERPSDLMAIDYEVDDGVQSDDVLAAWPKNAKPENDELFLAQLTTALSGALADATDAGVEINEGYSTSDTDVPSVARHGQNEYRAGFQTIVRVMAEIWTQLAEKSEDKALAVAQGWRDSPFRLIRRLAMFAFANRAIPADVAANFLIDVPLGELFLTNSSVEAYRLIRARWNDFPPEKQQQILLRINEGPPRSWFREGADVNRQIDRSRYELLSDMVRDGADVGPEAGKLLAKIRERWPQWEPKPTEQVGFHVWHESSDNERRDDTDRLKGIADDDLVAEARKIAATAGFMEGDSWHSLCLSDPDRALRGLDAATKGGDWPKDYWEQLLWSRKDYRDAGTEQKIAELLLQWPTYSFGTIAAAASSWLEGHAKTLSDALLWPLWDRIADATLIETPGAEDA